MHNDRSLVDELRTLIDRCPHPAARVTCRVWLHQLATAIVHTRPDVVQDLADRIRRKVAWEQDWHLTKSRRRAS